MGLDLIPDFKEKERERDDGWLPRITTSSSTWHENGHNLTFKEMKQKTNCVLVFICQQ